MHSRETYTHFDEPVTFRVKLYHPVDPDAPCKRQGESVFVTQTAHSKAELRTAIESTSHDFFRGDACSRCGSLAKVSIEQITDESEVST